MSVSRIVLVMAALLVAGCANKGLRDLQNPGNGPDEFMVMPVKPLEQPANFSELPPPTPGAANRTDPQPRVDAIVALGGRASALEDTGVPSADAGLVTYTSRNGVPQGIRQTLSEEDANFRRRQGRMTQFQIFRSDLYSRVYRRQTMNPFEIERQARRSGVPTPASPPEFE